jgi:hypothetical protein
MYDPNMIDFYNRVSRIRHDHAQGYGMEAVGALGRSAFQRRQVTYHIPLLGPIAAALLITIMAKAVLQIGMGDTAYYERLAELRTGTPWEQWTAAMMKPDEVSNFIATEFRDLNL